MAPRVPVLALLLVSGIVLAGCSGGGGDASSSSSSSSSTTSEGPTTTTSDVRTVTSTTTISGSTTVVTQTTTITATSGQTTSAGPLPSIENVTITAAANSATIAYTVFGGSGVLHSHAEFGYASLANYTAQTADATGVGDQSATLVGLSSCSNYKVRIAVTDGAGTSVRTGPNLFTTLAGTPLSVSDIQVPADSITDTQFKVTYTVAGPADVTSRVIYGVASLDRATTDKAGTGAQEALLTGLTGGQTYKYQVVVNGPCGQTTVPATPVLQKSAVVVHVDIAQGAAVGGSAGAFNPGSSIYPALSLVRNQPYVFDVTNKDNGPSAPAKHEFHLEVASSGASMGYSSGDIAKDATYHFPTAVTFTVTGTAKYHMKCLYHPTMSGDITITAS